MQVPKAIALMSGGLDSALAARLVKDQGVEVIGLHLSSPFGCHPEVEKTAAELEIRLIIKEKGESYLDLVKNPRFGYGRAMNPCIDCRIFMFQLADVVRQEEQAGFIVTGEVLGQRPLSQQRHSMNLIDNQSDLGDLVLRPLSAKLFEPTLAEREGWVDREKLLSVSGRARAVQQELAKSMNLTQYDPPGGGCLLTETTFAGRLKDFHAHEHFKSSDERMAQSRLLSVGRHFRVSPESKIVVGRAQAENEVLRSHWSRSDAMILEPVGFSGPTALIIGEADQAIRELAGALITRYGKCDASADNHITYESRHESGSLLPPPPLAETRIDEMRL